MKQTLRRELTNILFVVLIVAAAIVIFLLSRGERAVVSSAEATALSSAAVAQTPVPESTPTTKPATRGVPESVFLSHLETCKFFTTQQVPGQDRTYQLFYSESPRIYATLRYELEQGLLSNVEIKFSLPSEAKASQNAWLDKQYFNAKQALVLLNNDLMQDILSDLLPASVAKEELQLASVRYWVDQSLLLKKDGDDFEDTQDGIRFLAYRNQGVLTPEMIYVLFLS